MNGRKSGTAISTKKTHYMMITIKRVERDTLKT